MAKHIVKGYIVRTQGKYQTKPEISFYPFKPDGDIWSDTVIVAEHSIEVEVPDNFDPRPHQIAALKEKKKLLEAQFAASVKKINDRIQSLLAIEMS